MGKGASRRAGARGNRRPSPGGAARMTVGRPGMEGSRWEPDAGVPYVRIRWRGSGEPIIIPTPSVIGRRGWPAHPNGPAHYCTQFISIA